ncbi:MAG: ATP-binding cassette domain-containing protein [Fibrobacteria bacterium]|nr:ATP-binding cassette domain-containing protein [Fibrobacteria bacterium]
MIKVDSLSKRYGRVLAVDNISFNIEKGEVVGLLGPNGAGKTTTMKMLTSFLPCTAGRITVDGLDVFGDSLKVRQRIGYLPENCPLYMDMEVEQFLKFCAEIRGIDSSKRKKAVDKMIAECDLKKVTHKIISHLSKGYRQRVGLAQAMIHDPDILIMDEPTSGLDPNQIRDILNLINNLGQQKTVIHSTHILTEAESTSKRILIINNGKIVGEGTPEQLSAQSAGTAVFAAIKGEDVQAKLEAVDFIKDVSKTKDADDGYVQYAMHGQSEDSIAEDVFKLAVTNGWVINELHTQKASLEDVFARLTRG